MKNCYNAFDISSTCMIIFLLLQLVIHNKAFVVKKVDNNISLNVLHCAIIMIEDTGPNPLSGANQ